MDGVLTSAVITFECENSIMVTGVARGQLYAHIAPEDWVR
jgi:hypothetical protein